MIHIVILSLFLWYYEWYDDCDDIIELIQNHIFDVDGLESLFFRFLWFLVILLWFWTFIFG